MSMTKHEAMAEALHSQGYSCSQAVLAAFSDVSGLDQALLLRLSAGLGGGVADLHEICGALTSAVLALDLIYAEGAPKKELRARNDYPRLREVAQAFRDINGSIVCRELRGFDGCVGVCPKGKTCHDMVCDAARLVDEFMETHPINDRISG